MSRTTALTFHRSTELPDDAHVHDRFHGRLAAAALAVVVDRVGLEDLATTAQLRRGSWASDDTHHYEAALAVDADGRDAGAWVLEVPLRENLDTAYVEVLVPPAADGPVGEAALHGALVDDIREAVGRHGRSVVFTHEVISEIDGSAFDPLVLSGTGKGARTGPGAGPGPGVGKGPGTGAGPGSRYTVVGPEGASAGDRVSVRSGVGHVLSTDPSVRRMLAAGFVPVQVARMSVLDVGTVGHSVDEGRADESAADESAADESAADESREDHGGADQDGAHRGLPAGTRVVSWVDGTPQEWAAQMADLYSVFERTVPTGGAAFEPEVWNVARLREVEATARSTGVVRIVSAAAQGDRLVAFTLFEQTPGNPIVFQEHTVVRPESRGRGLAVLVKRANTEHLRSVSPDARMVCTWNAVENLPMLAVNNAAGFVPYAFSVLWEATLA